MSRPPRDHGPSPLRAAATLLALAAVAAPGGGIARAKPAHGASPPQECAAVILAGIPAGAADGRQQAGFYHSQLGRLELHAEVAGGIATDYRLSLAGHPLVPASRPWPKPVVTCLKALRLASVARDGDDCRGGRFKVVMTRAASVQYLLLYAEKPGPWRLCRAYTAP